MNEHSSKALSEQEIAKITQKLEQSCDSLDGSTLSRLNRIRHDALEHQHSKRNSLLTPFGGMMTACVLILTVSVLYQNQPVVSKGVPDDAVGIEDIEILTSAESLEFFENYEFYQWLAESESAV